MDSLVAIDVETTGLDPRTDRIIQIGAVRFNHRRVEDRYQTFINPGRPIPPFITQLTGINDRMVREAPYIQDVVEDLKSFAGGLPLVGHMVRFDLAFLRPLGILGLNDVNCTYELASVLLPQAGRYNLKALAGILEIPVLESEDFHTAPLDADVTRQVYLRLYEMAYQLPLPLLAEIVRLGEPVDWDGYAALRSVLKARSRETISALHARQGFYGPLFEGGQARFAEPELPSANPIPLDLDEVASILEYGGAFAQHFPNFEYRPQQVEMLRAVAEALSEGHHLLAEAGTGTGKSIAYLIPAALWAIQNNTRVIISTNTINLQDQLINKDIPDLCAAMNIDLRATVLKGRANYLCPRRLENLRRRGPESADEMRVLAKVLVWLQNSISGDRGELNLNGPSERDVWARVCAEDEGCTTENCIKRTGGACPFYRARQSAQNAHIIIVNHALLLADVATGNRVLPEYDYLIVDEAHHMEDATTNALSFEVTQFDIERTVRELGGSKTGALGWMLATVQGILNPSDYANLDNMVQRATDLAFNFDVLCRQFFDAIFQFLEDQREGRPVGGYGHQERILPATRTQPAWGNVELCWDEAHHLYLPLIEMLNQLLKNLANLMDALPEEGDDLYTSLSNIYRRMGEYGENLEALVFKPAEDRVYWAEITPNGRKLSLHAAPLHIGPLMEKFLWNQKKAVIMTSATLTTAGEFDYLRGRLLAETAYELALGSPFDYETSTLLYVVNDIPEPSDRFGHQRAVETSLVQLCIAAGGRTLALFTSYDQLKRTSQAIGKQLEKYDIRVFEQGEGASSNSLLDSFRTTERAVLLGTRAFWEGVDVPGEALSVLAIVKLPFDVPSDPIIAARAETFEDSFNQYSLPEAILRFRQGFGRLIRTQSDRGVVAVLDRRILTKRYGQAFIDSLPACTVQQGPLAGLAKATKNWLNL